MPTYTVTCPAGRLSGEHKRLIAAKITSAHSQGTGAPMFFAQVIFSEVAEGDHYLGGEPLSGDQIFIHGQIRAGRSAQIKTDLMMRIVGDVGAATGIPPGRIWVYISELPPNQMVEFGRVLPEPGAEEAWTSAMPAEDRARLEKLGRKLS